MRSLVVATGCTLALASARPTAGWAQGADPDEGGEEGAASRAIEPAAPSPPPPPPPAVEAAEPASTDHVRQFGLSGRFAYRGRGIATWDGDDYCGELSTETASGNAPVCTGRAPFSLDLEASYGIAPRKELLLELRLGLERDFGPFPGTDGPRVHLIAPGARFFFSQGKTTKLFTTLQVVLDFSGYDDAMGKGRGVDYGFRNLSGLWFDLHHAYGFYVFMGETLTFQRWLAGELEIGVGFQGRYP
jgi:hypothetical protein